MSQAESPAQTDVEEIKARLHNLEAITGSLGVRLDGQAAGINSIGENVQWLVQNLQGLFQMFASPQFVSQMSNMIMGSIQNGGQPDAGTDNGPESGASGSEVLGEVRSEAG